MEKRGLSGFLFFAFAAIFLVVAPMAQAATPFPIATAALGEGGISVAFDGTNYLVGLEYNQDGTEHQIDTHIGAQLISSDGTKIGSVIETSQHGIATSIAFDGTNYLMVWEDNQGLSPTNCNFAIYGQFISKSGTAVGTPFVISSGIEFDGVNILAYGNGKYLVAYTKLIDVPLCEGSTNRYIAGRIISPDGTMGSEFRISTGNGAGNSMAFDGTNFFVVWREDSQDYEIRGRFISPSGVLGTEISINASSDPSDNPLTVVFDGTNYLVVWTDEFGGPGSGEWDVHGQMVTPSGALSGGVIFISTASGQQILPLAAFDGTNYLVTWTDMRNDTNKNWVCDTGEGTCWDIYGQYVSKTGVLVGPEFIVNNDAGNQLGGAGGFNNGKYLALINTGVSVNLTTGELVFGDVYGVFLGGYGTGTHSASGTYTWDSGTGLLEMNWTSSDFICDGPEPGQEVHTGVIVTSTTMTWPEPDDMTWTREPGTPGDIVGVWTSIDPVTGNSYTLTINPDLTMSVVGNIVVCGDDYDENPEAQSQHWSNGYYVPLQYEDSPQTATSVSVTGPGISGSINLAYDTNWGNWNSWNPPVTPFLGTTYPAGLPYTYTFTITDGTGTWTADSIVSCFQEEFATNLSPTGTITTGTPTFSWTGIADTGVEYGLELHDSSYNRIWSSYDISGTSIVYNGPALTSGMTYNYNVVVQSSSACSNGQSFAQGSFTYGATPLYIAWTDDTNGNNEIFLKKSTDNGATWTFQRLTNNSGSSANPSVATSGNNVYVVWEDDTSTAAGVPEIFLKRSADSGANWTFQRLTNNSGSSANPSVATSGNNVYVVWEDDTSTVAGVPEIFLKKSIDGGNTWTFQRLTNNPGVSMNPSIRVNENNVYAVWQDDTNGNNEIFLKKSTDNGATWTFQRLTNNSGSSANPSVATSGNNVYVVWEDDTSTAAGVPEIFLKRSADSGANWTFQRLTKNTGSSFTPDVATSGNNVYVVWEDNTNENAEIFFKKSADGGNTWTFQRLTNNPGVSMNPSMVVDGGNLYVVWQDDSYGPSGVSEIFLKKSLDGGNTWAFQRLTNNTGNSVMGLPEADEE